MLCHGSDVAHSEKDLQDTDGILSCQMVFELFGTDHSIVVLSHALDFFFLRHSVEEVLNGFCVEA